MAFDTTADRALMLGEFCGDGDEVTLAYGPIAGRQRITIAAGDDYTAESGQVIGITCEGEWPDLTGAELTFTARPRDYPASTPIVGTGELVSQDSESAVIAVSIPASETENGRTHASVNWWYDLQATLADGTVRTLKGPQAPCTVLLDQTQ